MIFGIALVVITVVVISFIAYYDYRKKKNWPDHWNNKVVVYGTMRWRSAYIRASGMRVRRHGPPTSGASVGIELAASERTGKNGEYEIVLDQDGDGSLVVVDPDNNNVHLVIDPLFLSINSPRKLDLHIPSLADLRQPAPFVGEGEVTTHQEIGVVIKVLHANDGTQYRLQGPLASASLGAWRIEARGTTSGDTTRMYLDLTEYALLGHGQVKSRPFVGVVAKRDADIVATTMDALPSYHQQYGGIFVLTFAGDDVLVDTHNPAILERLDGDVGAKYHMYGGSRFSDGIKPEIVTPSSYGRLSD